MVEVNNSSTLSSRPCHAQQLQMSNSELRLWWRQAQAIGRSPSHLKTIERLIQLVPTNESDYLDISPKTYQVRCLDLEQFNRQALQLMEATSPLNRLRFQQLEPLVQELKKQWRQIKHWFERLASIVLDYLDANLPHK